MEKKEARIKNSCAKRRKNAEHVYEHDENIRYGILDVVFITMLHLI